MSFDVISKDKEMLWFPVLAGFFSILFSAALIVPTFVLDVAQQAGHRAVGPLQAAVLFVTYFGLSFIATFFNVCTVHTTRVRLDGGDATFFQSIKFAFSKIHLIAGWSLVSASVGLLLRGLDMLAERLGLIGKILLWILRTILASAWSIMTVFVVPAMVYNDLGPIDAIKDSIATLRQTWGENLIRYYGMGLVSFLCALPCIALIVFGISTANGGHAQQTIGLVLAGVGFVALLVVFLVFSVAGTVFNTALYHYAQRGAAPGFDPVVLQGVFTSRQR
jgi:hypothetical protein